MFCKHCKQEVFPQLRSIHRCPVLNQDIGVTSRDENNFIPALITVGAEIIEAVIDGFCDNSAGDSSSSFDGGAGGDSGGGGSDGGW